MSNRVMIAGTQSGCGKTTITCGILNIFKRRGVDTVSLKCGPDYIDPMFHREAIGTPSFNLDSFFLEDEIMISYLREVSSNRDIAVVEGVMGYFDGAGFTTEASSYEIACKTKTPVILVVNGKGMANSIGAVISGFVNYGKASVKNNGIYGVIVNNVSENVYKNVKGQIEAMGLIPCGYLSKVNDCTIESRHLGLVTVDMVREIKDKLDKLSDIMEETIDIEKIMEISSLAVDDNEKDLLDRKKVLKDTYKFKIAIARDEAFSFIYEENINLLKDAGFEIVYFSPIHDKYLPEGINGIILYGGYPEEHLLQLSANKTMLEEIRAAYKNKVPIIAECGGYMYLKETIEDKNGIPYKMAGVIEGNCYRSDKLVRFGYITLEAKEDNILCPKGSIIKGHEFHYWDCDCNGEGFTATRKADGRKYDCVYIKDNVVAGFPHLYYLSNPQCVSNFYKAVRKFTIKEA